MRLRLAVTIFSLTAAASAQQAVFVVRHAEKATESNEAQVPLSEAGKKRAARLTRLLGSAGITAVYATPTERARATAAPLADGSKLEIRSYAPREAPALVERLKKEAASAVVLVVAHSNTVPEILMALGGTEKIEIPSGQYDDLFVVVPKKDGGAPTVLRLKY